MFYIRKKHRPVYVRIETDLFCKEHELVISEGLACSLGKYNPNHTPCQPVELFVDTNPNTKPKAHTHEKKGLLFYCVTHNEMCITDDRCVTAIKAINRQEPFKECRFHQTYLSNSKDSY